MTAHREEQTLPMCLSFSPGDVPNILGSASISRRAKSVFIAILPSYIATLITHGPKTEAPEPGNALVTLDGLRGFACLFVFNQHHTVNYTENGVEFPANRWPLISILWSGKSMVCIFFVISGYVLSYKPLKFIRKGDFICFHQAMASSIVRRGIRLLAPSVLVIFAAAVLTRSGVFHQSCKLWDKKEDHQYLHLLEKPPSDMGSLWFEASDAVTDCWNLVNLVMPWDAPDYGKFKYDSHLWTIAAELRNSLLLFLILVGTSRLRSTARLCCFTIFLCFAVATGRSFAFLFMAGMTIAELDLIRKHGRSLSSKPAVIRNTDRKSAENSDVDRLPLSGASECHEWPARYLIETPWVILFITGLFWISGIPDDGHISRAAFLRRDLGAVLVTWAAANSAVLAPAFNNPLALYLGKISYAVYLVHGTVIKGLGYTILPLALETATRKQQAALVWTEMSDRQIVIACSLGLMFTFPVTLWAADVFWRLADVPSVRFARWVEAKISIED